MASSGSHNAARASGVKDCSRSRAALREIASAARFEKAVLSDHLVAVDFSMRCEKNFDGSIAHIRSRFSRLFLDGGDELRIETEALATEGRERNIARRIGRGRKHSGGSPGGFLAGLLAVEHDDAQIFRGKLERDRGADHAATHDGYVECIHACMLPASAAISAVSSSASSTGAV